MPCEDQHRDRVPVRHARGEDARRRGGRLRRHRGLRAGPRGFRLLARAAAGSRRRAGPLPGHVPALPGRRGGGTRGVPGLPAAVARKVRAHEPAGHLGAAGVLERGHGSPEGRRRHCGAAARGGRRRGRVRRRPGLRGPGLGRAREHVAPRPPTRGARGPPSRGHVSGQFPHLLPRGHRGGVGGLRSPQALLRPARGRTPAEAGRPLVVPPPQGVPGRGGLRPGGPAGTASRGRLRGPGLPGDLQRLVPPGGRAPHRGGRVALPALAGGPDGGRGPRGRR